MTLAEMQTALVKGFTDRDTRALVLSGMVDGAKKSLMVMGVILLGILYLHKQDWRFTFTVTPSLNPGLYAYKLDDVFDIRRDQLVRYHYAAPQWVRDRKWTHRPDAEWQLKRVRGIPGDRIEMRGDEVLVCPVTSGAAMPCEVAGKRLSIDRNGVPWPEPKFVGVIPEDHFYVMGDHPMSFDSRYFGLIRRDQIAGRTKEIWTNPLPREVFTADWETILKESLPAKQTSGAGQGGSG